MRGSGSKSLVGATCRVVVVVAAALIGACWEDGVPDDGSECTAGESRCNGLLYQTCSILGVWEDGPSAGRCGSGGGGCSPGTSQCQGTVYQVCNVQGTWESRFSLGQCGTCTPGATRCSGLLYQTCSTLGVWEDGPSAGRCGNR